MSTAVSGSCSAASAVDKPTPGALGAPSDVDAAKNADTAIEQGRRLAAAVA